VLFEVEDFAVFLIDFPMVMQPNSGIFQFKQGMHACAQQTGAMVFLQHFVKGCYGVLHGFLKSHWRFEGLVGFDFHNVKLHFFAESEMWHFNKIDEFSALLFYDFVADWQGLQFLVYNGVFVFWT